MTTWMLPVFSCRDLVAILMMIGCSVYLAYDSEDLPLSEEFEELLHYCENETLHIICGCGGGGGLQCTSYYMGQHQLWYDRVALMEFLNSTNLETINQGNDPTFCSGCRLEVIDITLGSFELLGSVKSWEVSSEPSLSDHRHILFTL
jgi:hypothetical protein